MEQIRNKVIAFMCPGMDIMVWGPFAVSENHFITTDNYQD
jgi:hypothetical protein